MLFYFKNLVILSLTLSTFGQTQRLQSYQNETEIFFNNCLKGYQIINQANKTPDKYYSCQTNPNGVQLETLLSTDSKKRYFCVKYVKNINSPQDFDTLEFFTNSEFKLSYTGSVTDKNAKEDEIKFKILNDPRYKGKFAFQGDNGDQEFTILKITVNGENQICKSKENQQKFPSLNLLQRNLNKKKAFETSSNQNNFAKKLSNEERSVVCGYQKKIFLNGVDENVVFPGKYPWFVAIEKINQNPPQYLCAGTIINENSVLTTANCLLENRYPIQANNLRVRSSPFLLSDPPQNFDHLTVKRTIIHENFDVSSKAFNIAVIKLYSLISYNDYISPACFPLNQYNVIGSQSGMVLGYGKFPIGQQLPKVSQRVQTFQPVQTTRSQNTRRPFINTAPFLQNNQNLSYQFNPKQRYLNLGNSRNSFQPPQQNPSNYYFNYNFGRSGFFQYRTNNFRNFNSRRVQRQVSYQQVLSELPRQVEFEILQAQRENPTLFLAEKQMNDYIYPDEGSGFYVKKGKKWRISGILSHKVGGLSRNGKETFMFVNIEILRKWMDNKLQQD